VIYGLSRYNKLLSVTLMEIAVPENIRDDKFFDSMIEAEKKSLKARKWSTIVSGMTSSIAVAITAAMMFGLIFDQRTTLNNSGLTSELETVKFQIQETNAKLSNIENSIFTIRHELTAITDLPEGSEWKAEASRMNQQLLTVSEKLGALESALTVDPAKALAVPILRKDLDNINKSLESEIKQSKAEIDRIYDQNKWFIGLMFTIALSVLGMTVTNFVSKKDT
jgi:hypothetical protein